MKPSVRRPVAGAIKTVGLISVSVLGVFFLSVVGKLLVRSSGRMKPIVDAKGNLVEGSISEKTHVVIDGQKMGMIIKSEDLSNPVLLLVHGGPGMPEYPLTETFPTGLERQFTVVWWDQRGAGLSYSGDSLAATMTVKQFVEDAIGVTNYLRDRFHQQKIYLMGHSWGSYIAIQAAAQSPELYHAYIGIGQISDQMESEKKAYEYMLDYYASSRDSKAVEQLQGVNIAQAVNRLPDAYLRIRDKLMHKAGIGTTHHMESVITGIFLPVMWNQEYTLREKINIWRGKAFSASTTLSTEMYGADLSLTTTKLAIRVYFFSGAYDYTVNHTMSEWYLRTIEAPIKGFYLFDDSAHSPMFEEPSKVLDIMRRDVLQGRNDLANSE